MPKGRLLAFSDGVIAILITIMVLELKQPGGTGWHDLGEVIPVLLAYVLSFVHIGIYWNNHHHLFSAVHRVNGAVLWANMILLFWLSLIPFTTEWMSENDFPTVPVAVYGMVLLASALSYIGMQVILQRTEGADSLVARASGSGWKGSASLVVYVLGIALSFVNEWIGVACYAVVALTWFIPDRRFERVVAESPESIDG